MKGWTNMDYIGAFLVCGLICLAGQVLYDHTSWTAGHITSCFVVIGALLDTFGIYDQLIKFGGAGAYLPITSFGHSLMHGTMTKVNQMGLLGIGQGMLTLTASGITTAIFCAFFVALICRPKL